MDDWLALDCARLWVRSIVFQGDRLLHAHNSLNSSPVVGSAGLQKFREQMDRRLMEEQFFLDAVGKALRWVKVAKMRKPSLGQDVDRFLQQLPEAGDVRNMREHDDAYFQGHGNKQAKFVKTAPIGKQQISVTVDASSTIVWDGDYLIGGRLNVQKAIEAARALFPCIEKASNNCMKADVDQDGVQSQ